MLPLEKELKTIKENIVQEVKDLKNLEDLEKLRLKYFSRKDGKLTQILKNIKNLDSNERKTVGSLANEVKVFISRILQDTEKHLKEKSFEENLKQEWIDVTSEIGGSNQIYEGSLNPETLIEQELKQVFSSLGFMIYDGPELGSDFYCFEALNIPKFHPARDMTDTLYIKDHPNWLMRTHTSESQVRIMKEFGAPLRAISMGRCYRNEAVDSRHEHTFYQCEGLMIDKDISLANLKYLLQEVSKYLFGPKTEIRLNPKFYPFVEPGFSGDVTCFLCEGKGCSVCKHSGWLEFFGAGMIHPNVLKYGNIDPKEYQGLAFGLGTSRMAMLKYGISDARYINSADLRFLKQF